MDKLLAYYQKELNVLKQHGKAFASRYPKVARRLGISEGETEDPHVSRLIESFALLTSRIHQRLDDDLPEVTETLISALAPQFLRPLPSACIVTIAADPLRSGLSGKNILPAGTALYSRQNSPVACQFQTRYPVTLLPLSLNAAGLAFDSDALSWQLRLHFQVWPGAQINDDTIRLYLNGPGNATSTLYTLLCGEVKSLVLKKEGITFALDASAITPVGFTAEEALLTRDSRIAPVHILLLDYFWFPQKFAFLDITLPAGFNAGAKSELTLQIEFQRNPLTERLEKLAPLVDSDTFRLHCTPAVNLFYQRAEPIALSGTRAEYPLVPDARHQAHVEVWAVDQVSVQQKTENGINHFLVPPLLEGARHIAAEADCGLRWQSMRRSGSGLSDEVKNSFIAFSEQPQRPQPTVPEIVAVDLFCTNHHLPSQLPYGAQEGDFDSDAPVAGLKITALTQPTRQVQPPEQSSMQWRFLSLLSLNHQLLDGEQGVLRLKEMLGLYDITQRPGSDRLVNLIQSLSCQPVTHRMIGNDPHSLARGIDLKITFHHDALHDPECYLLCSLLDRLLALHAPVNSFTRLTTCIEDEEKTRRVWPVRAGRLAWI